MLGSNSIAVGRVADHDIEYVKNFIACAKLQDTRWFVALKKYDIATIEIGEEHQGHSVPGGDLDEDAFADAVNYLKVRRGLRSAPMK